SSTGAEGIDISGSSTLTATSGNISLNGTAQSQWYGVRIQGSNITATNGSISLTGNSTNGTGLQLNGSTTLNATNGSISLTGNSTNGIGIDLEGTNILTATSGAISFNGTSGSKQRGINIYGTSNILNATEINLTGSSTGAEGIDISGNSTLTATSGNISLNGTAQSNWYGVRIQGSNITATNGSISLAGSNTNGTGLQLNGTNTLTATNGSINLTGNSQKGVGLQLKGNTNTLNAAGDVNINGTGHLSSEASPDVGFIYIQNATITSSTGNITIDGNVSNIESAVFLRDVTLNASKGDISIRGTSDYAAKHTHVFQGGTVWLYNTNMTAQNIDINATNTNATVADTYLYGDALFLAGNLTFTGNTTINATANRGAAILFGATTGVGPSILNMTFSNGSVVMNATNNGTSGISGDITEYKSAIATDMWSGPGGTMNNPLHVNISLSNSNLTICASSEDADGIYGSNVNSFWNITGTGNASITGMSQHGNGVSLEDININASGLNGTTTLTGIATGNGNGVDISGNTTLINVVVNGNGTDGSGVNISGNLTS
ncbi:hypothetical protein SM861_005071, partial [Escherichia coli]|nr:hypothetical protein [Escherichia coli]